MARSQTWEEQLVGGPLNQAALEQLRDSFDTSGAPMIGPAVYEVTSQPRPTGPARPSAPLQANDYPSASSDPDSFTFDAAMVPTRRVRLMAKNPLFSTYRQGENRITSSMLAVFERIDLSLLEVILAAAAGESSLQMVSFTNQPPGSGHSVPDARISARFAYWFEVKTVRNSLGAHQLTEHLSNLGSESSDERLFVITPDADQPAVITALHDPRVVWFNFRALYDAVAGATSDPVGSISEQARFLLRELQALLVDDGLVDSDDVVVVAARFAYPEYLRRSVYICQAERAFRDGLTHLGFYSGGAIQTHVPRIRYREDLVAFIHEAAAARKGGSDIDRLVGEVIDTDLAEGTREEGKQYQVFLLSQPDDPDTVRLAQPIRNDTVAESGRPWAWTMGQRYVSLAGLTRPGVAVTSDLASG